MSACERVPVGRAYVHGCSSEQAPRGASVVVRERSPGERGYICARGWGWWQNAAVQCRLWRHRGIGAGADTTGVDVNKTDGGMTPLFMAAQNGHDVVVRALIVAGADVKKAVDKSATPV